MTPMSARQVGPVVLLDLLLGGHPLVQDGLYHILRLLRPDPLRLEPALLDPALFVLTATLPFWSYGQDPDGLPRKYAFLATKVASTAYQSTMIFRGRQAPTCWPPSLRRCASLTFPHPTSNSCFLPFLNLFFLRFHFLQLTLIPLVHLQIFLYVLPLVPVQLLLWPTSSDKYVLSARPTLSQNPVALALPEVLAAFAAVRLLHRSTSTGASRLIEMSSPLVPRCGLSSPRPSAFRPTTGRCSPATPTDGRMWATPP